MAENEVNTGGGASIGGNVDSGGGDVAGRDSRKENVNEVTNKPQASSAVVIYNQPPAPRRKRSAQPTYRGELMADAAQTLWQAIGDLKESIGKLQASVENNSRATDKQADSIQRQAESINQLSRASDRQVQQTVEQFKVIYAQIQSFEQFAQALRAMKVQIPDDNAVILAPARQIPWWQPYATPVLLTLILAVILAYLSSGGRIP